MTGVSSKVRQDWQTSPHLFTSDYPSLGHIASVARDNSVNIIWAVTSKHINLYTSLTEIVSASLAGQIDSNSSNIVELIQVRVGQMRLDMN